MILKIVVCDVFFSYLWAQFVCDDEEILTCAEYSKIDLELLVG